MLATQTLRWSSPLLFNDPFDVPREMDLGFDFEELRSAMANRFGDYLDKRAAPGSNPGKVLLSALESRSDIPRVVLLEDLRGTLAMAAMPTATSMEGMRRVWRERIPGIRILCFSEIPDSPAMWAHYSDDHSGAVLRFESSDERDSCWLLAQPVTYRIERPAMPTVDRWARAFLGEEEIDWNEYLRDYYFVKSPDWGYEKEYRCVSDKKADETGLYSDYVFHREDLVRIILGERMATDDERAIRELARGYPRAAIHRAIADHTNRRISVVPAP